MRSKTKKLIWLAPLAAIVAVMGALAIFAAQGPGNVSADSLPGAVTNFKAEADGHHAIKLSWTAPAGATSITGYRIDVLDSSTSNRKVWNELEADTGSTATTYTHDGLDPNEENFYRVFPINSHGVGAVSEVKGATTKNVSKPGQVTGLTATANSATKITLSWTAPSDGGSPIVGYRIHMATAQASVPASGAAKTVTSAIDFNKRDNDGDLSGVTLTNVLDTRDINKDAPAATTVALDELRANHEWYFRVYAVNKTAAGDDQFSATDSDTVSAKTKNAEQAAAPSGLVAVPATANSIKLYWNWPSDDGGSDITGFRVEIRKNGSLRWPRPSEASVGGDQLNERLTGSNTDGNAAATASLIIESAADSADFTYSGISTELQDDKLSFRVRALTQQLNNAGTGSATAKQGKTQLDRDAVSAQADTHASRYDAPTIADFEESDTSHSSITVEWPEPAAVNSKAPVGYRVDYAVGDSDTTENTGTLRWETAAENINFSDVPYKHTGRKSGTQYFYRVFANPASTIGEGSGIKNATTDNPSSPGKVTGLTATASSPGQIDLNWSAPTNNGGAAINRYHVVVAPTSTLLNATKDGDGTNTEFYTPTHDHRSGNAPLSSPANLPAPSAGLRAATAVPLVIDTGNDDTTYSLKGVWGESTWHIQVYAVNAKKDVAAVAGNTSTAGSGIVVRKTGKVASAPAPIGLAAEDAANTNATQRTARGVVALWNAPMAPAGAALESYTLEWKSGDGEFQEWTEVDATGNNASTYETHNQVLKTDEVRMYRVQTIIMINGDGDQMTSPWVTVTYPTPGAHTHNAPVLSAIGDQDVVVNGTGTVTLSATDADGETVTFTASSGAPAVADVAVSNGTLTITAGANPGTAMITVTATDTAKMTDTETFTVTVVPANAAPEPGDAIVVADLAVGGSATVDLSEHFSDADMDTLTYAASLTANDDAAVTLDDVDGSTLTINGEKLGDATVEVTATDAAGSNMTAKQTFTVTVANRDPMPGAAIGDVSVKQAETDDVESTIEDADRDKLTWTWKSSDADVATVMADATDMSKATVTGVGVGSADITVTASDGMGGKDAEQTFTVTVTQGALTAPTNVMAKVGDGPPFGEPTDSVTVTWTDGAFADVHHLYLISEAFEFSPLVRVTGDPSAMTHTFESVDAGLYAAAVRSTYGEEQSKWAFTIVTVK